MIKSMCLLMIVLVITACAPTPNEPISITTANPDLPVNNNTSIPPQPNDFAPNPADAALTRSEAFLDSVQLLTLESYPLQFMLNLKGSLPTPCHLLRIAVSPPDTENKVIVDVYSVTNPDRVCVQVLAPFEINYSLGSFPEGLYRLWINEELITEFQA